MSVIKRKNKKGEVVWCVRAKINGRERFKTIGPGPHNKKAAEKLQAEWMLVKHSARAKVNPRISVRGIIDRITPLYARRVKATSWATYRARLERIAERFGDRRIDDIRTGFGIELQEWLSEDTEESKGLASKTVNEYIHILSKAFSLAVEAEIIEHNPLQGYKKLPEPDPQTTWYALEPSQIRTVMDHLPVNWFGDYIIALLHTGARTGEIRFLQWRSVDIGNLIIRIEPGPDYTGKTPSARRLIPILEPVRAILERNLDAGTAFPFPGSNPKAAMPKTTPENNWKAFQRRHGIRRMDGRPYRLHDLRHTYACNLARSGVNPVAAQRLLGHSDIRHTMIYYRLTDEDILSEGRKIRLG